MPCRLSFGSFTYWFYVSYARCVLFSCLFVFFFLFFIFFFNDTAPTELYTLSLHDALPILAAYLVYVVPTVEIAWVSMILVLTIYLFAFEVVGVDVAAASVMVLVGLT